MSQVRGLRRGVVPALVLAITLLAWIAASRTSEPRFPTASLERQQGSTIESASTLLVITSDRPRVSAAANRHDRARVVSAATGVSARVESPRPVGWDVVLASSWISIGPLGAGLTRRGPPAPVSF